MNTKSVRCPDCGDSEFTISDVEDSFQYGPGTDAVELSIVIPVHTCNSCGYQFTGHDAEVIRHEAVCRHLGRMTPAKIRELRESHNLTREAFAAISGIGNASLARWESGHLVQSAAYDNFLYLLLSKENLENLAARVPESDNEFAPAPQTFSVEGVFVYIKTPNERLQLREKHFDLHLH